MNLSSSIYNKITKYCEKHGQFVTPENICHDMVSMLDDTNFFDYPDDDITQEEYIATHRVLDIYCKSGNFLYEFYKRFMKSLRFKIPDENDRDYFIVKNLLFAFTYSNEIAMYLRERFYSNSKYNISDNLGNIFICNTYRQDGSDIENKTVKINSNSVDLGDWKNMKFDVVIGNPPYTDDVYLDFVMLGHKLSKQYDIWITPAKFIAKKELNSLEYYFKNLVVYLEAQEIFDIRNLDGIVYYLLDKNNNNTCELINKIKKVKYFNDNKVNIKFSDIKCCNIITNNLVKKLGNFKKLSDRLNLLQSPFGVSKDVRGVPNKDSVNTLHLLAGLKGSEIDDRGYISMDYISNSLDMVAKYKVCINTMMGNCFYDKNGTTLGLNATFIYEPNVVTPHPYLSLMAFDTYKEAESFDKYINTKFVKFLIFTAICSQNYTTALNWRFVPDPISFDRIYEDKPLDGYTPDQNGEYIDRDGNKHCSLYVKYKLADDEIKVIESVIRERK
jgi:hypothetical protein